MDFGQTVWIPIIVTGLLSLSIIYEFNWSSKEPESNGRLLLLLAAILLLWGTFLFLWGLLLFVEYAVLPFINYLSCTCKLF